MTSRKKSVTISSKSGLAGGRRRSPAAVTAAPVEDGASQVHEAVIGAEEIVASSSQESIQEAVDEVGDTVSISSEEGASDQPDSDQPQPDAVQYPAAAASTPTAESRPFWFVPVYRSLFCLSFGAVYSALFLKRLLPEDGAVARGMRDGGEAGRAAYMKKMHERNEAMSALSEART